MKLLHISDTHGFHEELEDLDYDVIVHSGDCSNWRDPFRNSDEVRRFMGWYSKVPCPKKIYVAGNHDTSIERRLIRPEEWKDAGIIYLENDCVTIDDIKFWGSPITPAFGDWAFMKARNKINKVWESIPEDTDVLITHGPPKGVRDLSFNKDGDLEMCGDGALFKWIYRNSPRLSLFGHIHDMDGVKNQGVSYYSRHKTVFSNGSCVTDGNRMGLTSFGNAIEIKEGN